jgi:hypothetical protein
MFGHIEMQYLATIVVVRKNCAARRIIDLGVGHQKSLAQVSKLFPTNITMLKTVQSRRGNDSVLRARTPVDGPFCSSVLVSAQCDFGVISYAVRERTQEIGVRVALGASPLDVLSILVRQGM